MTADGGAAVVTARLREKGELFAITGKRADDHCYDNSYRAEYTMVGLCTPHNHSPPFNISMEYLACYITRWDSNGGQDLCYSGKRMKGKISCPDKAQNLLPMPSEVVPPPITDKIHLFSVLAAYARLGGNHVSCNSNLGLDPKTNGLLEMPLSRGWAGQNKFDSWNVRLRLPHQSICLSTNPSKHILTASVVCRCVRQTTPGASATCWCWERTEAPSASKIALKNN